MRSYSKVERFLWRDPRFREISEDAQKLWLYLLSCPNSTTCPGLFLATQMVIIDDLCWVDTADDDYASDIPVALQRLTDAIATLVNLGWMQYDTRARIVYIPRALRHNMPESPNVVRSWATALSSMPTCDLRDQWIRMAQETLENCGHASLLHTMQDVISKASIRQTGSQEPCLTEAKSLALRKPRALGKISQPAWATEAKSLGLANQEQEQKQEQDQELASADAECEPTPLSRNAAPDESEASPKKATAYHEFADPLARFLEQRILEEKPDTRRPTEAAFNGWVRDMHRIIAIDNRDPERVRDIIDWATRDDFWAANVRSPAKLRMQFDRLELELDRRGKREASKTPRQREETNPDRALGCYQDIDEKMRRAGIFTGGAQ